MPPLKDVLVLAVEQAVAAPMCTQRLVDAGARVIKIERPGGETARHYDRAVNGTSAYFAWLNRGKESIALDLKSDVDRALFERMLDRADVLIQNLAPNAMTRLGWGPDVLAARWPRLIFVDIVGYAQDSAYRDMKAYDMLIQAEAGLCAITGTPDEPAKVGASVADIGAGLNAYAAILEALIERGRTGKGCGLSIAMFDCVAEWMAVPLLHYAYDGRVLERRGLAHNLIAPYARYRCKDGAVVIAVQTADEWHRFCAQVLGNADLAVDPRFSDNARRIANIDALDKEIVSAFSVLACEKVVSRLKEAGLPFAQYRTLPELALHPALRRVEIAGEEVSFWTVASPLRASASSLPPALDQDGAALRSEFAD